MYDDTFIGQVICIQICSPYMLDRTRWATVLSLSFIISDGSTGGDVCLGRLNGGLHLQSPMQHPGSLLLIALTGHREHHPEETQPQGRIYYNYRNHPLSIQMLDVSSRILWLKSHFQYLLCRC